MDDTLYGEQYNFVIVFANVDDFDIGPKRWCIKILNMDTGARVYPDWPRDEIQSRSIFFQNHPFLNHISDTFDGAFAKCLEIDKFGLTEWYEKILVENGYYSE